ncbi:MAG: Rhs family [Planctomycetota bacterium]|nr:MAG: Rhs family [Planctomycetota bacterium]
MKNSRLLNFWAFGLLLAGLAGSASGETRVPTEDWPKWSPPWTTHLSPGMLDADPSGILHGIIRSGGLYHGTPEFAYRDFTGEGKGELISADSDVSDCRIIADDLGGLHAFYLGIGPEGAGLYYCGKPAGGEWSPPGLISTTEPTSSSGPRAIRCISVCTLPDFEHPEKKTGRVACFYAQEYVEGVWPPEDGKITEVWVGLRRYVPGTDPVPDTDLYMLVSSVAATPGGPFLSAHRGHLLWIYAPAVPGTSPPVADAPRAAHLTRLSPDDATGLTEAIEYTFPEPFDIRVGPCSISVDNSGNYATWWSPAPSTTKMYSPALGLSTHTGYDVAFRHDNTGLLHRFRVPSLPFFDHSVYVSGAWSTPVLQPMLHLDDGFRFKSIGLDQADHLTVAFFPKEDGDLTMTVADPPSRAMCTWEDNLGDQGELVMANSSAVSATNVSNGNTFITIDALEVAGHGPQLDMMFYYNSLEPNETICGNGWRHSFSATLRAYPHFAPKVFVLTFPDGRRVLLEPSDSDFLSAPQYGISLKLGSSTSPDASEFEIEFPEKLRWNFNTKGKLTRIRDRDDNTLLLTYGDNPSTPGTQDVLLTATDLQGRSLSFTYDARNRMTGFVGAGSGAHSLAYGMPAPDSDEYFPLDSLLKIALAPAGAQLRDWSFTYHAQSAPLTSLPPGVPGAIGITGRRCALASVRTPSQTYEGLDSCDYWFSYWIESGNFGTLKRGWEPLLETDASRDDVLFTYSSTAEPVDGGLSAYKTDLTTWGGGTFSYWCEYKRGVLCRMLAPEHSTPLVITYDDRRNPRTVTDTGGFTATYVYSGEVEADAKPPAPWVKDAVMSILLPGAASPTLYRYYSTHSQVSEIVPFSDEEAVIIYEYDSLGHQTSVKLPGAPVATTIAYDSLGRVVGATDPGANATAFTFDGGTYGLPKVVKSVGAYSEDGFPLQIEYSYNTLGQVTSEKSPSGASMDYFYDGGHRLTKMTVSTDSGTADYTWKYDADDNVTEFSDPNEPGAADKSVKRDCRRRVTEVSDADGKGMKATLNKDGLPTKVVGRGDGEGTSPKLEFGWDGSGRCTSTTQTTAGVTSGGGVTLSTSIVRSDTDQVLSITQTGTGACSFTRVTEFEYETTTDLLKEVHTAFPGVSRIVRYDSKRRVKSEELHVDGAFFRGIGYVRDHRDRPIETWQLDAAFTGATPTGRKTEMHYDPAGNLTARVSPASRTTTYAFDSARRLISTTDPSGVTTKTNYAKDGQVRGTSFKIPGHSGFQTPWTTIYNDRGLPWKTSDNINPSDFVERLYDDGGRLTRVTGPEGLDRKMEYTVLGRLTKEQVRRSAGDYITMNTEFDPLGNPKFSFVPGGTTQKWQFEHDTEYRLISRQAPIGVSSSGGGYEFKYFYNASGKLCETIDEDGNKTDFERDALDRITKTAYSKGSSTPWAEIMQNWDAAGNLKEVSDGTDTVQYDFNFANELTQVTWLVDGGSVWRTVEYDHDADGILTEIRVKEFGGTLTHTLHYDLDPAGRMAGIKLNGASVATFDYEHGFLVKSTYGNGTTIDRKYDKKGRVKSLKLGGSTETASIEYTYDKRDRPTQAYYAHYDLAANFTYSDCDWLTSETYLSPAGGPVGDNAEADRYGGNESDPSSSVTVTPGSTSGTALSLSHTYSYDDRGNRVSMSSSDGGSSSYVYDDNGRLTDETRNGSSISYLYSQRGDLTKRTDASGISTFEYDYQDRLTHVETGGAKEDYAYWPSGQRKSKANALSSSDNEWYLPDGDNTLADYKKTGSTSWSFTSVYCHNGLDQIAARQDASSSEQYFFQDSQNSVHRVTGVGGTVLKSTLADAWGNDIDLSGPPPSPLGTGDRWGFAGRERDTESGLMYFRARTYDPSIGRFLSYDPVWQHNLYFYGENLPTVHTDPFGKDVTDADKAAFAAKVAELDRMQKAGKPEGYGAAYNDLLNFASKLYDKQGRFEWIDRGTARGMLDQVYARDSWIRGTYGESSKEHLGEALDTLAASQSTFDRFEKSDQVVHDVLWTLDKAGTTASMCLGAGGVVKSLCQQGFMAGVKVVGLNFVAGTATSLIYNAGIESAATLAVAAGADPEAVEWAVRGLDAGMSIYGMTTGLVNARRNAVECFVAGTPVETADGPRAIEKVKEGDFVLAWDENTGELVWSRVEQKFETPSQRIWRLTLKLPDASEESLECTPGHPFWVEGQGWVPACQLEPEDQVATLEGAARVAAVAATGKRATVYNFEVGGTHNYLAGVGGVLVHNVPCTVPANNWGRQHGGPKHWQRVTQTADKMVQRGWRDVRVNRRQVDVNLNPVGRNRPDVSGTNPRTGVRHNIEFDTNPASSARHRVVVNKNDPASKNTFVRIP